MSLLFWIHATLTVFGIGFSVLNIRESVMDHWAIADRDSTLQIISDGWLVREMLYLGVQLVFAAFLLVFLTHRADYDSVNYSWTTRMWELRAVMSSGFVMVLSTWNWWVRVALRRKALSQQSVTGWWD